MVMLCQKSKESHKFYDSIEQLIGRFLRSSNGGNFEIEKKSLFDARIISVHVLRGSFCGKWFQISGPVV